MRPIISEVERLKAQRLSAAVDDISGYRKVLVEAGIGPFLAVNRRITLRPGVRFFMVTYMSLKCGLLVIVGLCFWQWFAPLLINFWRGRLSIYVPVFLPAMKTFWKAFLWLSSVYFVTPGVQLAQRWFAVVLELLHRINTFIWCKGGTVDFISHGNVRLTPHISRYRRQNRAWG